MTISDILVALRVHYKTGEYQIHIPMHDIVNVIKGLVEDPLLEEIAQLNTEKQNMASQISYLSYVRLEDWCNSKPTQSNPPPPAVSNTEPHTFTALGKIWISHKVGDSKRPVGCSASSRSLTETYTVVRGGSASINWENKLGWYPVDKHGNDLPSGAVYKFKAAALAGKKVEFYNTTAAVWYGITARWFAEMDNKATTNIADATNPDCYRIVEDKVARNTAYYKAAYEAGKKVEYDQGTHWLQLENPTWEGHPDRYRIV